MDEIDKFHSNIVKTDASYIRHRRVTSYALLLELIENVGANTIVDVGCNRKVQSKLIEASGRKVTTVDFDPRWEPDVLAGVEDLPFSEGEFDCAVCTQVLEHLPYNQFVNSVKELSRVSAKYAIISLPYFGRNLSAMGYLPIIGYYRFSVPFQFRKPKNMYDGDHHWEIGKKGFSVGRIRKDLVSNGVEISRELRNPANPYHIFFVIQLSK